MLKLMKRWQAGRAKKTQRRGYDYAAGMLLSGEETPQQLRGYASCGRAFDGKNPFDDGILLALEDWRKQSA